MRFSCLAAFGLVLVAIPAMAQQPPAGKHSFGRYTCSQQVPCDRHGSFTAEQWAQAGSSCVSAGFGINNAKEAFDPLAGLDTSNCLTINTESVPQGKGARLVPYCCVEQLQNNTCVLQCNLIQE
jgi:hypothetical protein